MQKINYSILMEDEIEKLKNSGKKPSLLLHSCCAPCSSAPLEILCRYFDVTVFYYNPNIYPEEEYFKRCDEQKKFCDEFLNGEKIKFTAPGYEKEKFLEISKGLENEPEKGRRCTACYALRLERSAKYAAENGFDYFTTTLSVSPLKDASRLNNIGSELAAKHGVRWLFSDFKKKEGYKRSCVLSEQFGIYRQDYCGCIFSLAERYLASAKGIIFDVDGTLCDTMGFYEDFLGNHLKSLGIVPEADIREKIRGYTVAQAYDYVIKKYNIPKTVEEMMNEVDILFSEFYGSHAFLKPGVKEFIDYAKNKNIKMCIATATEEKYIRLMTDNTQISDFIEFIITSSQAGRGKNFPDIYDKATEMLGLTKNDVLIFEDAYHAAKTAKNAGYRVVAVKDEYQEKFKDLILKYSDIYIESTADLIHKENLLR